MCWARYYLSQAHYFYRSHKIPSHTIQGVFNMNIVAPKTKSLGIFNIISVRSLIKTTRSISTFLSHQINLFLLLCMGFVCNLNLLFFRYR